MHFHYCSSSAKTFQNILRFTLQNITLLTTVAELTFEGIKRLSLLFPPGHICVKNNFA